jgi:hypothetical protein
MPRQAIIHPFALAPRFHQAGPLQAGKVSRYFRLNDVEGICQFADTRFTSRQQIEQAEPGCVGQRFEKKRRLTSWASLHFAENIYG